MTKTSTPRVFHVSTMLPRPISRTNLASIILKKRGTLSGFWCRMVVRTLCLEFIVLCLPNDRNCKTLKIFLPDRPSRFFHSLRGGELWNLQTPIYFFEVEPPFILGHGFTVA